MKCIKASIVSVLILTIYVIALFQTEEILSWTCHLLSSMMWCGVATMDIVNAKKYHG